jgi:ATP phosphoribosyltransferase
MEPIKIAVQKSGRLNEDSLKISGRLNEDSLKILKDCGISIDNGQDQLKASARNFPMEVLYLRNGDIPQYLKDGVVDMAIIGENILIEKGAGIEIVQKLGFSKCRVSLAIPKEVPYSSIADLKGKRIATSYPNTVEAFLRERGVEADLHIINGSVEIAPNIGLADAICDIVSSGSTLFKNNLREVEVMLQSEAVLAVSPKIGSAQRKILGQFIFRLQSVLEARQNRYVLMNAPNDRLEAIIQLLPGMRSPTVLPLAEDGWSSIHTVINKDRFWEVLDQVKKEGAEGILVCPIEKMIL